MYNPLSFAHLSQEADEQAWLKSRIGRLTASKVSCLLSKPKSKADQAAGKLSATAETYLDEICSELAMGKNIEISGKPLDWGKHYEPEARAAFEEQEFVAVTEQGMIILEENQRFAASLDGFYADANGEKNLEIKCPYNVTNHLKMWRGAPIKKDYIVQMQWQMAISGRQACTFASYHPEVREDLRLFTKEVARDEAMIANLLSAADNFLVQLDAALEELSLPKVLLEAEVI